MEGLWSRASMGTEGLPDFGAPPVVETVLAVRIRDVPGLDAPRLVKFWDDCLSADLPTIEERPPYDAPIEQFGQDSGTSSMALQVGAGMPSPRFFCSSGNDLVQLQQDWFAYNWRKTPENPDYTRYEKGRAKFERWLVDLSSYVQETLGETLMPTQCEVTYINHVALTEEDLAYGPLGAVLRDVQPRSGAFLPLPETSRHASAYVIPGDKGSPVGRLHVAADRAWAGEERRPIVLLSLTARGAPRAGDIPSALEFLDLGRYWVVKGFVDLTTDAFHRRWGLSPTGRHHDFG